MIALSPEQKKEDQTKRITAFRAGLEELQKKHQLVLQAQIMPDGPILNLEDTKEYA